MSDNEQMNEALLDDEITKERSILGNVIWTGMLFVKKQAYMAYKSRLNIKLKFIE